VLSFFGVIHSVTPAGGVYLPWTIGSSLPYHWSAAYFALAGLLMMLARSKAFRDTPPMEKMAETSY